MKDLIVTLFSVPTICELLMSHPLVDCRGTYTHLTGLELADDSGEDQSLCVDILIGSDHYWDLITGRLQRGADGPVLSSPVAVSGQMDELHSLVMHTLHIGAPIPLDADPG